MRLLFYVEHFKMAGSGLENQAVRLCKSLAERGHEVHVLSDDADDVDGLHVHHGLADSVALCGRILPDLCIDWGYLKPADIHRLGGGTHNQFIQYNLAAYSGLARVWKKLSYLKQKHQRKIARERTFLRNPAAHVLANSNQTAQMAIADGADAERVRVHHQTVDLEQFSPKQWELHRAESRKALGVGDDEVAFIFIAHNLTLKNLDLLRRVFTKLAKSEPVRLIVAGKRKPGFSAPWLTYAGTTDRMETFYAAADGMLHPTYFDSCANVVIEAMACGLPVVVSDTAGINEIISDGDDGRVLSVRGNRRTVEEEWRKAITELTSDAQRRSEMGRAARRTAEKYGYGDFLDWFEEYLKDVRRSKGAREGLKPLEG